MDKRRRLEPADDDKLIIPAYDDVSDSIATLDEDIRRFETHGKVPEGLSPLVSSSNEDQSLWFQELSVAWPKSDSPLKITPEEAAKHIALSIMKVHKRFLVLLDLQGFFLYYGLLDYCPLLEDLPQILGEASSVSEDDSMDCSLNSPELGPLDKASSVAEDAMENTPELDPLDKAPLIFVDDVPKFQMKTLPVLEKGVTDECLLNVFVEVKEFSLLPLKILIMLNRCRKALANGEDCLAQELLKMGEYEIVDVDDVKCLTKKYQIKIRGINALDIGVKTREKLVEMVDGKQLTVVVYCFDDSGKHWVGDVYCDGICLLDKLCGSEALRD